MTNNDKVTITRPFVSWYCQGVYIIDPSRKGSVQVSKFIETDNADDKVWLTNVYVAKPFRHLGIATRCIKAARRYCQRKGIGALYLWCLKDMIKFYEQFGFETTSQHEKDLKGRMQYVMVCTIKK